MALFVHFLLFSTLLLFVSSIDAATSNQDLLTALQEMRRATYFTFVVLINMAPDDFIQGNVTFLMPNNRILANTTIPQNNVGEFLQRHSIPSPLLIDDLRHFPTGSIIPTSRPDFMLRIGNYGRRQFFLNNVRVTSPNICTAGSSIRCHGIDGVIIETYEGYDSPIPIFSPPCYVNSTISPPPVNASSAPTGAEQLVPTVGPVGPPEDNLYLSPTPSPILSQSNSNSSNPISARGLLIMVAIYGLMGILLLNSLYF